MEPGAPQVDDGIPAGTASLLSGYRPEGGRYDEMLSKGGKLREGWDEFLSAFGKIRKEDFVRRWEQAQKLIHENGITYNVYDESRSTERPWELDPVPFVLPEDEWKKIEGALVQRARVLDRILADCYGSRELIRRGLLPPDVVFGNPRFFRPCAGIPQPRGRFLHFYAVDIARAADGQWWVLGDRTQAPSGMGYALENRVVQTRMVPEVARDCRLVRLVNYFREVLEAIANASPRRKEDPRIVLLTPGPLAETYFEHAFLARYLGIALVEGEDLTVRDDHVYLKTLDGLQPVDVILRRLDEEFADPLELMSESQIGVAGILGAIRAGNVAVLNPPGSGLAESPALLAFLPIVCRELLGEDLKMPSVATWWCGQPEALTEVLGRLDKVVIKSALERGKRQVRFPGQESEADRKHLEQSIRANPMDYVAQEIVSFSTAPVWNGNGFDARTIALRVHLVATDDGYAVMPGGLTRFAGESGPERPVSMSMQKGSGSKDTWIVSKDEVPHHQSIYDARYPLALRRSATDFPSRTADNLYWLGRYAERSEFAARVLRQIVARMTSEREFGALPDVAPLWSTVVELGHLAAPLAHQQPAALGVDGLERALFDAIFGTGEVNSLRRIHDVLQRVSSISRDALSHDSWRITQQLAQALQRKRGRRLLDLIPILDQTITLHAALSGMASENTTHTQGWRFLDLGRRLERALYLIRLGELTLRYHERGEPRPLESVLEVIDSSITYRRRHFFAPRLLPVLDLLIYDPTNPRSLAYQFERVDQHLALLPAERVRPYATEARKLLAPLLTQTRTTELSADDLNDELTHIEQVKQFLGTVEGTVEAISSDLTRVYFSVLMPEQSSVAGPSLGVS
ncbi:hypothetical protein HAHE_14690 [Haloferula helveola]|uniref:DUF403 domain-containing protein n=1 Tax=Haloferula helveola TaxID=490095 RepID=A0ABN6H1V0_9BACT|nr:hypothetical protein HAHE_14690 [Haloferula helveola]